ncbi:MAG: aminotransferase class IV [Planctomycetota bacterium]
MLSLTLDCFPTPVRDVSTESLAIDSTYDIYLNGRMLPADDANVSVSGAGFQHAVGLFETFQVYHGKPFRLEQHLARLAGSARELGLAETLDPAPLADAVRRTVDHNRLERARVRLTLTAGTLSMLRTTPGQDPEVAVRQTVAVVPAEPTAYDPAYFTQGITALIHGPAANPFNENAGHKTLDYWARLRSLRRAAAAGAGEAIWLNVTNHLASGAISNLLLVKDQTLYTPFARGEEVPEALRAPVLPGVTRAAVLELAASLGLEVKRKMLTVQELLDADEVLLTNSGWGVLPVTKIEKHPVADGQVGPQTQALREALLGLITAETT